ncbi:helix-turn-helix domain-containing protein [Lactiplantibacillus plajomi]|nr:helix-turn-helix domain-containing protein [Lactiplantibacillus plajomi]
MPRSKFTAEEKLTIINGLSETNLTKKAYLKLHNVDRKTFGYWQEFYALDGLEGLKEQNHWTRYSPELKQQAVMAYLNQEGSLETIRTRFGIRTKSSLRDWIKKFQYNRTNNSVTAMPLRKQVRIMGRKTTFEERIEIVEYVTVGGHSYSQAAEHFNVSYQQARSWVLKAEQNGYPALKDRRGRTKPREEMTELERLKLENRQLRTKLKEQGVLEKFVKKFQELQNKE